MIENHASDNMDNSKPAELPVKFESRMSAEDVARRRQQEPEAELEGSTEPDDVTNIDELAQKAKSFGLGAPHLTPEQVATFRMREAVERERQDAAAANELRRSLETLYSADDTAKNVSEVGVKTEYTESEFNPNKIGEILPVYSQGIYTTPDKVYRSVRGNGAVLDLLESGVVRNAQTAGVKSSSRWGESVFWERGKAGVHHNVMDGGFVLEAPYEVASNRAVTLEDVTGIYEKNKSGQIRNNLLEWKQRRENG